MASPTKFLDNVETLASDIIRALPPGYSYHCYEHTAMVVDNARMIARGISLSEYQTSLLLIAAWLHDVGFRVTYSGHEKESRTIARNTLANDLSQEDMESVEGAILSTEIPQRAPNLIAELLCDADLLYLGGDQFFTWSSRLREEHLRVLGRKYTDLEWCEFNIRFVRSHTFFTEFAREHYDAGRAKNLHALEAMREALVTQE